MHFIPSVVLTVTLGIAIQIDRKIKNNYLKLIKKKTDWVGNSMKMPIHCRVLVSTGVFALKAVCGFVFAFVFMNGTR